MGRLESVFIAMERKGSQKSCQVLKSVRFMEIIHFALGPQNFPDEFLKFFYGAVKRGHSVFRCF